MPVQKLIANTTNEGLKRIREEIGSDALILKTVKRNGKVEFFVEAEDPIEEIENVALAASQPTESREQSTGLITEYRDAKFKMFSSIASKVDVPDETGVFDDGREPPRQKRQLMQRELTVKNLIESLELTSAIGARLRGFKRIDEVVDNLAMMIQPGPAVTEGIHAFVGPAGSGKTTSLVKLITRHIMQHGEDSCAIINCDRFRMGAREQLTRLGKLMGVDVLHVGPGLDLNQAIANVHKRRFVAIDMPGYGMQDEQLYTELFRLSSSHYQIQRFLVIPANLQFSAMELAHNCFASQKGSSCILTRLDETSSMGAALSLLVQTAMPLAYSCDGPHIPEDISLGRGGQLVQVALTKLDGQFAKAEFTDLTNRETFHKQNSYSQEKVMDI